MQLSHHTEGTDGRWNSGISLLFVLRGEMDLFCRGKAHHLQLDDLFVINDKEFFFVQSDQAFSYLELRMDMGIIYKNGKLKNRYSCDSSVCENQEQCTHLKKLIAEIIKQNSDPSADNDLYNLSMMFRIYDYLNRHFAIEANAETEDKQFHRISQIIQYIDEHYTESITLKDLSKAVGLTTPYLSHVFEKYMGVNFLAYYTDLRLQHCLYDLAKEHLTIGEVGLTNGFSDPRSFTNAFKRKFGMTPAQYREETKKHKTHKGLSFARPSESQFNDGFYTIAKYLAPAEENKAEEPLMARIKTIKKEGIDTTVPKAVLRQKFKTFTSVARAKELLYHDVQEMLRELQRNIGFEFIKFHGLLSDDMLVYTEDKEGNPHYSYVLIDKALDFLMSIGLKPMIEFSFMPKDLVGNVSHEVFASPMQIGFPKSMEKWNGLIRDLMSHLVSRYGVRTVRTWLFTAWNEPDTTQNLFGFETDEEYFSLYKNTRDIVKSFSSLCKFGSPSVLYTYKGSLAWLEKFLAWAKENNCSPEFLNLHYYDNDFSGSNIEEHSPAAPATEKLNMDPNAFSKAIKDLKEWVRQMGLTGMPFYLTEWNLTVSHRNLINDTCFKSCYLAKNLLENFDELDAFGYWVLTDMIEETQPSNNEFHGGLGLFTYDQIKKPHYFTFEFLNKLGSRLIDKGDGYFIAKSHGQIQIFLYNYEHFNLLFASGKTFDMTFTNRYTPFSQSEKLSVTLGLTGLSAKKAHVVERIINQQHGSAFDEWVRLGAPDMNEELLDYLRRVSIPKLEMHNQEIIDGSITIEALLEPLEIRLIELSYE